MKKTFLDIDSMIVIDEDVVKDKNYVYTFYYGGIYQFPGKDVDSFVHLVDSYYKDMIIFITNQIWVKTSV